VTDSHQRDLYAVLGVAPSATADELRLAYRTAARAAHPDRHGDASAARMAAVNEAWHVLGDPGRRAAYDATRQEPMTGSTPSYGSRGTEPGSSPPVVAAPIARVPWRFFAFMSVAAVGLFVVGRLITGDPAPFRPDGILRSGDCLALDADALAVEVPCSDPFDGVVLQLVPFGQRCPTDQLATQDRQGMGTVCWRATVP
jgi:hypothetical protein